MITSLVLAAVAASTPHADDLSETVQNRSFYAIGWSCNGEGCRSNTRQLGPNLRFKVSESTKGFDSVKMLTETWSVMLDCTVVRDRLAKCEVVDDAPSSREARNTALKLSNFFRVQSEYAGRRSIRPHAIVSIQYETGGCPSWACTVIPEPAPPPPPPASTPFR